MARAAAQERLKAKVLLERKTMLKDFEDAEAVLGREEYENFCLQLQARKFNKEWEEELRHYVSSSEEEEKRGRRQELSEGEEIIIDLVYDDAQELIKPESSSRAQNPSREEELHLRNIACSPPRSLAPISKVNLEVRLGRIGAI